MTSRDSISKACEGASTPCEHVYDDDLLAVAGAERCITLCEHREVEGATSISIEWLRATFGAVAEEARAGAGSTLNLDADGRLVDSGRVDDAVAEPCVCEETTGDIMCGRCGRVRATAEPHSGET